MTAAVALGQRGTVFVNPYTGDVLGSGSARARAFYRSVTSWHRYLSVEGEQPRDGSRDHRRVQRRVPGARAQRDLLVVAEAVDVAARQRGQLFRSGLSGKARDFNWHNVIGFWCAPILVILTASGMVISYTWASNLVYTRDRQPEACAGCRARRRTRRRTAGGRGGRGGGPARAELPRGGGEPGAGRPARAEQTATDVAPRATLASLVARAEQQVPTWRTMIVRLPQRPGGPVAFSMSDLEHWNTFARSTLTLDGRTGAEIRWEPYAATSRGQKLRGWMRFAHTGELGGLTGEAVAGLASAGGAFLVYTGVALALRRLAAWRARRRALPARETQNARVA